MVLVVVFIGIDEEYLVKILGNVVGGIKEIGFGDEKVIEFKLIGFYLFIFCVFYYGIFV